MKWLLVPFLFFTHWYYTPLESPSNPVEINSIDLNLKKTELAMTFFSLSDGEAALIQHPNGKSVLINSGGRDTKQELINLLNLYHVKQIDTVLLTSDKDCCVKNLNWMIEQFSVRSLISGRSVAQALQHADVTDQAMNVQALNTGEQWEVLPGVVVKVIQDNEGMDLVITFLNQRILWLNQSNLDPKTYLPEGEATPTTIVKLPGRLSEEFVSDEIMKKLDPQMAFFFPENRGEINNDLLEQLHHSWVRVFHNHDKGAITVKFTENNYEILKITDEKK
ncbi:hypothetical protein HHO41_08570 [Bacillus sp. DNRA2]|uniref:hypothetical protein n=1 Tax=Bacillus sp. DNRA2 TaxID=2723053 RepID=UPI00145DD789|nr:hypothetical protein [Bacillus sp. DNRA2]NMD70346.1 hypothetical protein [Bacillus sp. DNRA2]